MLALLYNEAQFPADYSVLSVHSNLYWDITIAMPILYCKIILEVTRTSGGRFNSINFFRFTFQSIFRSIYRTIFGNCLLKSLP